MEFFGTIKRHLLDNCGGTSSSSDKQLRIAIGNGTACRETENVISQVIAQKLMAPIAVEYWSVSGRGAVFSRFNLRSLNIKNYSG
jgi:hypothetical protein